MFQSSINCVVLLHNLYGTFCYSHGYCTHKILKRFLWMFLKLNIFNYACHLQSYTIYVLYMLYLVSRKSILFSKVWRKKMVTIKVYIAQKLVKYYCVFTCKSSIADSISSFSSVGVWGCGDADCSFTWNWTMKNFCDSARYHRRISLPSYHYPSQS